MGWEMEESPTVIVSTGRRGVNDLSRRPAERGAAAVEFAIVLLPLLMLLLGIVEFGRVYSAQLNLQHAARDTARELALYQDDGGGLSIGDLVDGTLDGLLGESLLAGVDVTYVACSASVTDATVTLEREVELAIPMPDGAGVDPFDITAQAQMPCEA